ncbi:hypothetical protein LWI29_031205 [Acer saccharum]|uniref:Ubiquitin-like protease family profile domain-containing protein n=1 Tax=Acer saccharum TaxID=4024 RepID=A0AA39SGI7_ACESA|nr:hypothetical protein LWI29_031205 [Acer saccharum]
MTPPSSKKRFQVFDFDEEDEHIENTSAKLLCKYGIHKRKNRKPAPTIDKYSFLECFVEGAKLRQIEFSNEPIDVDVGVSRGSKSQQIEISNELIDVDNGVAQRSKTQQKEITEKFMNNDNVGKGNQTPREHDAFREVENFMNNDNVGKGNQMPREHDAFREVDGWDAILPSNSLDYENEQVGVISDDDECTETSSSTSSFPFSENEVLVGEQVTECGFSGEEYDIVNMTVVVSPDFIVYRDIYCTESRLTFSCSCIKLEGSTVNGTKEKYNFEWAIGDVTKIESEWCGEVESAMINLTYRSKDCTGDETAKEMSGTELLRFVVHNRCWSKVEEAIKSLDVRYKDIWHDILAENEENALSVQKNRLLSRGYFFEFDEPFEDVIYPKGDPDAILISEKDVELLQPETFINDTIIDFYIKYLKNKIQPEELHRFHFFNSFFFRKLADLDKDPSSACEGKAAFQRVRKWTRKVNLFEKDYVFIPINYSFHWSLIVICHPGEVVYCNDDEIEKSPKVPCILHMDSIKGSHRGLKNLFQSYLCEEWKERHSKIEDDVPSKFSRLRFLPLELPQQENSFDCGLFLLHYVECFLNEAPSSFSPFKIMEFSNFLNRNWFLPMEASLKRAHIKKLIYEICESHSHEDSSADCDEYSSSQLLPDKNGQDSSTEICCHGYSSIPDAEKGNEVSMLAAFSCSVSQQTGNQGFLSAEIYEPQFSTGPFSDRSYQQITSCHKRSIVLPTEEVEEIGEDMANSPSEVEHFRQITVLATVSPSQSKDLRGLQKTDQNQQFLMHLKEQEESISRYQDISKLEIDEGSSHLQTTDKLESSSTSSLGYATCAVEDSEEENDEPAVFVIEDSQEEYGIRDDRENKDSQSFSKGDTYTLSQHGADLNGNIYLDENELPTSNQIPVSGTDEQLVAKQPEQMYPKDGKPGKKQTGSL